MRKHTALQKIAALLSALCLLMGAFPAMAADVGGVAVQSAALTTQSAPLNGMVRVWLSSLGSPSRLDLTVAGSYSLGGDLSRSFSSGTSLTVSFNSASGQLTLSQNGVVIYMGGDFSLRRHSTSGVNGIMIAQARKSGNPYPGDLSFQAVKQSGGSYKLYVIAHVYIEDYLYGVVPYEMGNSSNVEALKAQAVAARTYTVRMMSRRASNRYDVVDTTSDQVYRGTPSGNDNCVTAIDSTRGIVLQYGGEYVMTYYSASNGGQTESAPHGVGSGAYAYFTVKDDPFDYGNPSSTVKKKTVYKDLTAASNPSGLISLLGRKAAAQMGQSGVTPVSLQSVTPHTPKYEAPSRLYTKMDFELTARTASGSLQTVTVTCDIFSEMESMLGMSIQSAKNELWSVEETASGFSLQARRYGHGVGMSQRGAMYMGKLGYTYDEILGFYYEGCQRVQKSFTSTILSASSSEEETTVRDPADLPENSSACKGTVKLVSGGSLILRSGKYDSSSVVSTLSNGTIVEVLTNDGSWCFVRYGSLKGYVPTENLVITGTPQGSEEAATTVQGFVTVTANDYVNLRQEPSLSAKKLGTAPTGAVLTVFSLSGDWAYVQYMSITAYVHRNFISALTTVYPGQSSSGGSSMAIVTTQSGTGTVNLRTTASTVGAAIAQLPVGSRVTVLSDDGSWCRVQWDGLEGYMMRSFLRYEQDAQAPENTPSPTESAAPSESSSPSESPAPTPRPAGVSATVASQLVYLRQEPSENSASVVLLAFGDPLTVYSQTGEWWQVSWEGSMGYLPASAVRLETSSETPGDSTVIRKARVTTVSGGLNMRMEGKSGSPILTVIPRNAVIDVLSVGDSWCQVSYGGRTGYVMTVFLTLEESTVTPTMAPTAVPTVEPTVAPTNEPAVSPSVSPTASPEKTPEPTAVPTPVPTAAGPQYALVTTASGSLNLRAQPSAIGALVTQIPRFGMVEVLEYGSEWCRLRYNALEGYAMTRYLTLASGTATVVPTPSATPAPSAGTARVNTVSGGLNLRQSPKASAKVLTVIPRHARVEVLETVGSWSHVRYGTWDGYVVSSYLQYEMAGSTPTPVPTATPASGETNAPTPSPAPVTAAPTASVTATPSPSPAPVLDDTLEDMPNGILALIAPRQGESYVAVWTECRERGEKLAVLPEGSMARIIRRGETWCEIQYDMYDASKTGYCLTQCLNPLEGTWN